MLSGKLIGFVGTGVMAEAMIRGLLAQSLVAPEQIRGSNPLLDRNDEVAERYGIATSPSNITAAEGADIVVLSTKPQVLSRVFSDLKGRIAPGSLVISICAGVPIRVIQEGLDHRVIARSMPNTPAQIGKGMTVWTSTEEASSDHRAQAQVVFQSLGREIFVDHEEYLDMATALSGSGPGYIYLMMEAMIDAGVHLGFSRRVASEIVFQTILGSVEYAEQSGRHVAELRNQVTSPGGTTAAALYHMEKGGFRTVLSRGIYAAYQRSVELGEGFDAEKR
jgi:pyrroline-5-carboxylate reductase